MKRELLVRMFRTPDGTVLKSQSTHDYASHDDANGETYIIDGGTSYLRTSVNKIPMKDISVWSDDPIEEVREHLVRYSVDGPVLLKDMTLEHLFGCIAYNNERGHGTCIHNIQYAREIAYRFEHGLI